MIYTFQVPAVLAFDVEASTSEEAQTKAQAMLNARAEWEVAALMAEHPSAYIVAGNENAQGVQAPLLVDESCGIECETHAAGCDELCGHNAGHVNGCLR